MQVKRGYNQKPNNGQNCSKYLAKVLILVWLGQVKRSYYLLSKYWPKLFQILGQSLYFGLVFPGRERLFITKLWQKLIQKLGQSSDFGLVRSDPNLFQNYHLKF